MNKRGDILLIAVFLIVIVMLILMVVDNFASRGCRSDDECSENSYCGVDKQCHNFPVIKETVVKETAASGSSNTLIIALAIIIGAIIIKSKKISF